MGSERGSYGDAAVALAGSDVVAATAFRGTWPAAPITPMSDGTFSESASPDGTTINEPRLTMLS